ncbi:hypothetical protein SBV1_2100002 [Verrucomicrobia bacterium]|nr:hypothetical protein SBV1_2100002 [Verrucomicrobiota bacterium]
MIVDRSNIGHDLAALCVRCFLVAEEKHEVLTQAGLNDAAKRTTVNIDADLASGILRAELRCLSPTEGMAEDTYSRHVKPAGEFAGGVGSVEPFELIKDESDVGGPSSQQFIEATGLRPVFK